jgi:hypothetical protein
LQRRKAFGFHCCQFACITAVIREYSGWSKVTAEYSDAPSKLYDTL